MNVTAGRNGLSPCLLVFGVSPRIPTGTHNLPIQRERMLALSVARSEIMKFVAKQRLSTALRRHFPKMTGHDVPIVSDVLFYKERLRNESVGPYKVIAGENKNLLLNLDGRINPESIDKIKIDKEMAQNSESSKVTHTRRLEEPWTRNSTASHLQRPSSLNYAKAFRNMNNGTPN